MSIILKVGDGLNLMFGILRKCVTVSFVLFDLVARMPVPKMVKNGFDSSLRAGEFNNSFLGERPNLPF